MAIALIAAMSKQMPDGLYIDAIFESGDPEMPIKVERYTSGNIYVGFGEPLDSYRAFRLGAGAEDYNQPLPLAMVAAAERKLDSAWCPGGILHALHGVRTTKRPE